MSMLHRRLLVSAAGAIAAMAAAMPSPLIPARVKAKTPEDETRQRKRFLQRQARKIQRKG